VKLPNAISALRHRDFRLYWCGQAISLIGTWMQVMAQGWVMTDLSSDAFMLGLLNAAGSLPILLLSLKGGELADRMEKRRILIATQVAMMLLAFVFAALSYSKHLSLPHIFALAVLLGIATAFDLPAAQSMPPELVEPREIPNTVALMQAIFHGARLIGPAIAGILIAHFGRGSAFVANGVSFIAVIFTLTAISPRPAKPRRARAAGRDQAGRGQSMIGEGLAYVRSEPAVRALLSLTALITALVFPFLAVLMIYYVRYTLGTDDARIMGLMMSASGLGSLIGAAAILSGSPESRRSWLAFGILGVALGIFGLSFARTLPFVLPLAGLMAFSVSSLMGRSAQMVQERVPGELRGRVMGIYSMTFTGIMPAAAMLWSFLVDRLGRGEGYPLVMRISAGLFLVSALGVVWHAWDALDFKRPPPSAGEPT
jgi:MFS family permease